MAAQGVQHLDALDIFTKGDIERVRAIIPPWMAEYNTQMSKEGAAGDDSKGQLISSYTPLHFAVQCPRRDVILAILENKDPVVPINAPDEQGMTALHLAAKASRKDVVKMLLRHGADDMLLDSQGHDPLVYAVEPDVAAVIQDHRSELVYEATFRLFGLVRASDSKAVDALLANPADASRINLAARDSDTGGTLLHLAVQHDMVALAKWAITEGVDVFARDAKSQMAEKYVKTHQMRELLTQAPMGNARTALSGKPPKFSGELHKWTNYAGGWKTRWFELEDGVLSYYKNKADADSSCRGAINLRIAKIMLAKEKTQFEVHGKGSIKYRLKANDPAVAKQWVHLLNVSKQWALENHKKLREEEEGADTAATKLQKADAADSVSVASSAAATASVSRPSDVAQGRPRTSSLLRTKAQDTLSVKSVPPQQKDSAKHDASTVSLAAGVITVSGADTQGRGLSRSPHSGILVMGSAETPPAPIGTSNQSGSTENPDSDNASIISNESDDQLYIMRDAFFAAVADMRAQLFIQDRLLDGLNRARAKNNGQAVDVEELEKYVDIATQATDQSKVLLDGMEKSYRDTQVGWQTKLHREQERITMLADSLRTAVVSSQNLAESMRQQMRRTKQQSVDSSGAAVPRSPQPPALVAASTCASANGMALGMQDLSISDKGQPSAAGGGGGFVQGDEDGFSEDEDESEFADASDEFFDAVTTVVSLNNSGVQSPAVSVRRARSVTAEAPGVVPMIKEESVSAAESERSSVPMEGSTAAEEAPVTKDLTALSGYPVPVDIRTTLPAITNGGPSLNLWSVIKGAIGKDLSKISVPVFFNEPTSFLQRFTEDMEYCDLLEIATLMPRSEDRTLFVAGFAMSNYASTFGRIAKPFNPLLGETYEYVRRDKKYRALSEQVEHHPPISACWVEGKNYVYHADTNIKSKFNGGSLTVVPTGVCHVELKLPLAFLERDEERSAGKARQDPKINHEEGYFTEHYTWNKLTTNVNGIMLANFWIEHVGDLDVKNHRTGDSTKITFVQSNWMGKNKFKVTGEARNRRGDLVYEIGGDWTSKLVAKPVGKSEAAGQEAEDIARPATMDDADNAGDAVKYSASNTVEVPQKPFVLWKVNDRQSDNNTYHLTTYAMTLNNRPAELEPYLCPTDSRFRPDQRAMETGEYDIADQEKSRLENKQRATRRKREQGELATWKPRWFAKAYDEDSGESYWRFSSEYWTDREVAADKVRDSQAATSDGDDAGKAGSGKHTASIDYWSNVEDIF